MLGFLAIVGAVALVLVGLLAAALILSMITAKTAGVTPHPEDALKGTRSIGDLIEAAKQGGPAVHVVFVHGIRAQGPGTSDVFQAEMRQQVKLTERPRPPRHYLDLGPPPPATYAGEPVWTDETWKWSRPFVDRRAYADGRARVIVDEVNWWPMVFPLKGRYVVFPEIDLAGPDLENLALLAKTQADPPPDTYWPWLTKAEIDARIRRRPRRSGGAPINAALKQQLMNWGLVDAVIALGPMRSCFQAMMDGVFRYAAGGEQDSAAGTAAAAASGDEKIFVIVSESLGSFIVMDVLTAPPNTAETAKRALLERTFDLYFFANQFRLLALGRLWDPSEPLPSPQTALRAPVDFGAHRRASPLHALEMWSQGSPGTVSLAAPRAGEAPRQIIAFNDPSDALTYEVPAVSGAKVANVYDRNSVAWLWLLENPIAAHTGHSQNRAVMRTLFERRAR